MKFCCVSIKPCWTLLINSKSSNLWDFECSKMQNMKVWLVFVFASCGFVLVSTSKCDRTPEGSSAKKSPPDGRYKLKIQHDPQHFMPGETYNSELARLQFDFSWKSSFTVSLEVVPARPGVPSSDKFTGFFIGVEKFNEYSYDDLGSFEIIPMTTVKFSEKCRNLVTHASTYARPSVAVILNLTLMLPWRR